MEGQAVTSCPIPWELKTIPQPLSLSPGKTRPRTVLATKTGAHSTACTRRGPCVLEPACGTGPSVLRPRTPEPCSPRPAERLPARPPPPTPPPEVWRRDRHSGVSGERSRTQVARPSPDRVRTDVFKAIRTTWGLNPCPSVFLTWPRNPARDPSQRVDLGAGRCSQGPDYGALAPPPAGTRHLTEPDRTRTG